MKKSLAVIITVFALMVTANVYAAKEQKGASEQAYEHASDEAVFNRVGDWFATIGKSKEEKDRIKAERKAARMKKKAEKKAKELQEDAEEEGEKVRKKMKDMEKEQKKMKEMEKEHKSFMHKEKEQKGSKK